MSVFRRILDRFAAVAGLAGPRAAADFHELFVAPYEARIKAVRRRHGSGVRELRQEQRDNLHAALRGGR